MNNLDTASPSDVARYGRMIAVTLGSHPKSVARQSIDMALAADVLANLASYAREDSPRRPPQFDDFPSDELLLERVKAPSDSARPRATDTELAKVFGIWREAILAAESRNEGRLRTLLYVARTLAWAAKEHPASKADLATLQGFLEAEWGIYSPPPVDHSQVARIAFQASRDRVALPWVLRETEPTYTTARKRPEKASFIGAISGDWMSEHERNRDDE